MIQKTEAGAKSDQQIFTENVNVLNSSPFYTGVGVGNRMLYDAFQEIDNSVVMTQIPPPSFKTLLLKSKYTGIGIAGDTATSLIVKPFPRVVVVHHPIILITDHYPKLQVSVFKYGLRKIQKNNSLIIMYSNWGKNILASLGIDPEIIHVVRPYSLLPEPNTEELSYAKKKFAYLQKIPDARANILAVGTSQDHKNFVTLYKAAINQKMNVIRIGADEQLERDKYGHLVDHISYVREKILSDMDVSSLYHLSDMLVFTGTEEGFGRPLIEALSSGIPVIGNYCTTVPEILGEDLPKIKNPFDHQSLLTEINSVMSNYTYYRDKARLRSLIYTKKQCASDLKILLKHLADRWR